MRRNPSPQSQQVPSPGALPRPRAESPHTCGAFPRGTDRVGILARSPLRVSQSWAAVSGQRRAPPHISLPPAVCYPRLPDSRGMLPHLLLALEIELLAAELQPVLLLPPGSGLDTEKNIVRLSVLFSQIVHIVCGHQG